jgi:DNA-binding beta-propeller fold protein YncE
MLDASTGTLLRAITVPRIQLGDGLVAVDSRTNRVFAAAEDGRMVRVFDATSGAPIRTESLGTNRAGFLAVDDASDRLLVAGPKGITVLDAH